MSSPLRHGRCDAFPHITHKMLTRISSRMGHGRPLPRSAFERGSSVCASQCRLHSHLFSVDILIRSIVASYFSKAPDTPSFSLCVPLFARPLCLHFSFDCSHSNRLSFARRCAKEQCKKWKIHMEIFMERSSHQAEIVNFAYALVCMCGRR